MAYRQFTFTKGEYYHIYNRGIDKRKIFFSKGDWNHFQKLLFLRNSKKHTKATRVQSVALDTLDIGDTLVDIIAYALMENHFHLLLREKAQGGISKFMQKFSTAYSLYMNIKYNRSGSLMCSPFRAKHVDSDEYFRWLVSYIHMNPIDQIESEWQENGIQDKKAALKFLREYKYSSYPDYFVGERDESLILNKEALPINIDNLEDLSEMLEQVGQYQFN